jgi:8-oxo-dGTP pyrophosphatase MutT (NUDIX family)
MTNNASAVLLSSHYVLLVVTPSGNLSLPGGGVKPGEKGFDAMSREWREETGMHRPTKDQADLSNKFVRVHRNGTTTAIYYGQTKKHYTWYTFNRDGLLRRGETIGLVWMKVSDAIRHPLVKSYCKKSLVAMKAAGCI